MIRWLRALLGLHEHKWEIIAKGSITRGDEVKVGDYYHLQCIHCGEVKMKNLM